MRRYFLISLILIPACSSAKVSDRPQELASCQLISKSGDELARCLVMKFSWRAESAGPAKYAFQRQLDSIENEHAAQVAILIAQQDSAREQVLREQRAAMRARERLHARIDSAYASCEDAAGRKATTSGRFDYQVYVPKRAQCVSDRNVALKAAGFPPGPPP